MSAAESKQPIPSVMARLMGLEELLPQQSIQKRARVLSKDYLQRVASIGLRENHSERYSFRSNVEEQKEHNDIFQILETLKSNKRHTRSFDRREVHSRSWELKMTLKKRDYLVAKRHSMDKKHQNLKEFASVPNVINSKTDGFAKLLQEPALQKVPSHLQSRHIAGLKPLYASDFRDIGKCRKARGSSKQWHLDCIKQVENVPGTYSHGKIALEHESKHLGSKLDSYSVSCLPTSRIVVLKPSLGVVDDAASCFPTSTSSSEVFQSADMKYKEIPSIQPGNLHVEVKKRKNLTDGVGPVCLRSRSSEEAIRQRRIGTSRISAETPRSEVSGINNHAEESRTIAPSLTVLSERENVFYHSDGYVAREAKKKIFERWRTTKMFQQVELAGMDKTSGEMLGMPDLELRPANYKPDKCGLKRQVRPNNAYVNFCATIGLRCWGGWKDGHVRNAPISRSLLDFNALCRPNTRITHDSLENGSSMIVQEPIKMTQNDSNNSNQKDVSESRNFNTSYKMHVPSPYPDSESDHPAEFDDAVQKGQENKLNKMDSCDQNSPAFKSSGLNEEILQDTRVAHEGHKHESVDGELSEQNPLADESSVVSVSSVSTIADMVTDAEIKLLMGLAPYPEVQQLESTKCILSVKDEDSFSRFPDTSLQQGISNRISKGSVSSYSFYTDPEPESMMCLDDAYQPSPDSVLGPLCKKGISSISDCFASADVFYDTESETLKSETSEAYSEGSGMMVSSDEDTWEGSISDFDKNAHLQRLSRIEESRDFSYLVDVLNEAGIHSSNLNSGFDAWPSHKCPIKSSVFENLEKKYGEQLSWKRSERKLLFDRINSGVMEVLQPFIGMLTWKKPVARRFSISMEEDVIEEELWMFLVSQEKEASKESGKVMGKDDKWLELADDIEMIGIEIENSLVDELVDDVVGITSF